MNDNSSAIAPTNPADSASRCGQRDKPGLENSAFDSSLACHSPMIATLAQANESQANVDKADPDAFLTHAGGLRFCRVTHLRSIHSPTVASSSGFVRLRQQEAATAASSTEPGAVIERRFMILVTSNKSKQMLQVRYIERVQPKDFQDTQEDFLAQLGDMAPGFSLLTDFSQLKFMELDCAAEIGRMMEVTGRATVGLVVRVIPDPRKDIGMNILTAFHYTQRPRIVTCKTLLEAARALAL
jgi:hypothetical protein